MLPRTGPSSWVGADGNDLLPRPPSSGRGCGHPPQQFIYQPAIDQVLREGVARFGTWERSCFPSTNRCGPPAGTTTSNRCCRPAHRHRPQGFARPMSSRPTAARPTRGLPGVGSGKDLQRTLGGDRHQGALLQEWDAHDRLRFHCRSQHSRWSTARPAGAPPLGVPGAGGIDDKTVSDESVWKVHGQGITEDNVRSCVPWSAATTSDRRPVAGRPGLPWPATPPTPYRPWIGQGMSAGCATPPTQSWKLAAVLLTGSGTAGFL